MMKKSLKKSTLAIISAVLAVCCITATISAVTGVFSNKNGSAENEFDFSYNGVSYKNEYERLLARDGFIYGMDNDVFGTATQGYTSFGDNTLVGHKATYHEESFRADLHNIKAFGFNAVNVWVIMDGSYGLEFDKETGLVTGIQDKLLKNVESALKVAREVGIDVIPTIQPHGIAENGYVTSNDGTETASERAYKYYRFYWDGEGSEARKAYMKAVKKLVNIFAEYQDVIPIVGLTVENGSGMVNDPETGMLYTTGSYGKMTWKDFSSFVNELGGLVKEAMPNMMTSVEDVGQDYDYNQFRYNELENLDIIGRNLYSSTGKPQDPKELYLTKPTLIGEYNIAETGSGYTEERIQEMLLKFFPNSVDSGYKGLFFFGWPNAGELSAWSGSDHSNYDNLRQFLAQVSYYIRESKSKFRYDSYGTQIPEIENPEMLYYNGGKSVSWIGTKGVAEYELYRSFNGGEYEKITTLSQNDMTPNGLFKYEDSENYDMSVKYQKETGNYPKISYKVIAVSEDGKRIASENGNYCEYFIPVNLIVDGGFEALGANGGIPIWNKDTVGWGGNENPIGVITDTLSRKTEDTPNDKYCLYIDHEKGIGYNGGTPYASIMLQDVQLEGGKKYKCSLWAKTIEGSLPTWSVIYKVNESSSGLELAANPIYTAGSDDWQERNIQFIAPEDGKVRISFIYNHDGTPEDAKNKFKAYIDDVTLVEVR